MYTAHIKILSRCSSRKFHKQLYKLETHNREHSCEMNCYQIFTFKYCTFSEVSRCTYKHAVYLSTPNILLHWYEQKFARKENIFHARVVHKPI